jgi:hypothetical protein
MGELKIDSDLFMQKCLLIIEISWARVPQLREGRLTR